MKLAMATPIAAVPRRPDGNGKQHKVSSHFNNHETPNKVKRERTKSGDGLDSLDLVNWGAEESRIISASPQSFTSVATCQRVAQSSCRRPILLLHAITQLHILITCPSFVYPV